MSAEENHSLYGDRNASHSVIKKKYTISAYTENQPGLLHRVISIFTRRKINIENINASQSEIKNIYRYTIVVFLTKEDVEKVVKQLEKIVEVIKAFYHLDEELIFQEIALYKVPTRSFMNGTIVEKLVRKHNARILDIETEFTVIEKTGHKFETQALFDELEPFGVLEFSRSSRVAITKPKNQLHQYLSDIEVNTELN